MKRNLIFILVIPLLFASCSDDFLQRNPTKSVTDSNFFNSETELELYSNGFYSYVPGGTDLMATDFTASDNIEVSTYSAFLAGVRTVPASGGGWSWTMLRNINYFLAHYRKADIAVDRLNYYEGFAKFFRAWFYFEKIKMFGDVPWYSEPLETTSEELYKGRDSRTVVADSILVDLDRAIRYLGTAKSPTRISRWTALALKSRFCLYEGTYRKYHPELGLTESAERFLTECVNASAELIADGGYSAYNMGKISDYGDMFTATAPNAEFILARTYDKALSMVHSMNYVLLNSTYYAGAGMTRQMVESYLMKDGTFFSSRPGADRMTFAEECANRDLRLAQTIRTPGYMRTGTSKKLLPDFDKASTGYQVTKYVTGTENDASSESANAIPVFRYSEVLLNYAEARAELGDLTQSDLDMSINEIRPRAGLPDMKLEDLIVDPAMQKIYPGITDAAILEIRRERRIELAFEGFRWTDLMRWRRGPLLAQRFSGMYIPKMGLQDLDGDGVDDFCVVKKAPDQKENGITYLVLGDNKLLSNGTSGFILPQPYTVKTFDENRDYLYPIPLNELTINKNLTQNPGWNF